LLFKPAKQDHDNPAFACMKISHCHRLGEGKVGIFFVHVCVDIRIGVLIIEFRMLFFFRNQLLNFKKFLQKKSEVKLILIRIILGWVTLQEV
jgi:hypothetical protein